MKVDLITTYRVGMLSERARHLREQANDALNLARRIMINAGLNPDLDQIITEDGGFIDGNPVDPGEVLRGGKPIVEPKPPIVEPKPPIVEPVPEAAQDV